VTGRWARWALLSLAAGLLVFSLGVAMLFARNWAEFARLDCRAAVLLLHQVVPDHIAASRYAMRETEFVRQLDALTAAEVRILSEGELLNGLAERTATGQADICPWGGGAVLLTFDMDGPSHHVDLALPHLVRLRAPALFFVPTGSLDQGGAVSSQDIETLAESGMSIASHSKWHRNLTTVASIPLIASLSSSRDTLQTLSAQPVRSLAAPGGRYDDRVLRDAREAGFGAFFNSDPCYVVPDSSPMRICRIEIRGDRGATMLDGVRSARIVARQATSWKVKRLIESLVGGRVWKGLSRLRAAIDP
jgi:peptidoglycan/xylan/chitin deacetylase (PgdA/CDA1 family)